jgi:HK97 family phage portal protein
MPNLFSAIVGWMSPPKAQGGGNSISTSKELEEVLLRQDWRSKSGVPVTTETAMMVSAVSAAVSIIAESVAQLPLVIYRKTGDRKERATDLPLWTLLHDKPNEWQTSFEFREMLTLHVALWGNAYAFKNIVPSQNRITELLPIHPDRVQVEQDDRYVVTYRVSLPSGEQIILPKDRVFHIRDRSFNGYQGMSRLKHGRDSIGLALVAEQWGAQLFGNGARPSGVLSTTSKLNGDQIKQIAESWRAAHGGGNALGTAVLDDGMTWSALTMNNTDAQFLELRKFQISEISRLYRIPPHMLGDLERATFSNIEHQSLEFVKYSLMPWLKRWETAINTQLIGVGSANYAEFLVEGLLRGDTKSRFEAYQIAIMNGWMSPNEVRMRENLNPRDGGDDFMPAESLFGKRGGGDEPKTTAED